MPTPSPIIEAMIGVMLLMLMTAAARYSSMNAEATAMIAKISGITVGTNARNRKSITISPAIRPKISLEPESGAPDEASPVNCRFSPAFSAIAWDSSISALVFVHDRSKLCFEKLWSKKPTRPVFERFPFSNGLVVRVAYWRLLRERDDLVDRRLVGRAR